MTKKFAVVTALLVALVPTFVKADCDAGTFVQQLSSLDRVSSSGTTLTDAAGMVQQDRFNVFNGRQVDLYDTQDDVYDTKEARSELNKDVAALLSSDERRHIEASENTIVTVNFEKCLNELPKAVSVGVSQLTVLPDGLGAYAINHLNYTDDHGFFRYENISSSLSELGHVFLPEEEAEMTVAFVGDPDYAIVQLPESLYCGSLGCNFLVLDRFGALVADVFGVLGEVYVRQSAAPRKSELLFFDGKGAVVSVPLNANAQAAAVATPTQDDLFVVANTLPPDDYLSLRTDPSTKSGSRITKMPNGTKISVLERRHDGWWLVEMVDTGQRGWAKSGTNSRQWIVNEADVSVTNNDSDQTQSSAINQTETTQDYSDVIAKTNKDESLASNSDPAVLSDAAASEEEASRSSEQEKIVEEASAKGATANTIMDGFDGHWVSARSDASYGKDAVYFCEGYLGDQVVLSGLVFANSYKSPEEESVACNAWTNLSEKALTNAETGNAKMVVPQSCLTLVTLDVGAPCPPRSVYFEEEVEGGVLRFLATGDAASRLGWFVFNDSKHHFEGVFGTPAYKIPRKGVEIFIGNPGTPGLDEFEVQFATVDLDHGSVEFSANYKGWTGDLKSIWSDAITLDLSNGTFRGDIFLSHFIPGSNVFSKVDFEVIGMLSGLEGQNIQALMVAKAGTGWFGDVAVPAIGSGRSGIVDDSNYYNAGSTVANSSSEEMNILKSTQDMERTDSKSVLLEKNIWLFDVPDDLKPDELSGRDCSSLVSSLKRSQDETGLIMFRKIEGERSGIGIIRTNKFCAAYNECDADVPSILDSSFTRKTNGAIAINVDAKGCRASTVYSLASGRISYRTEYSSECGDSWFGKTQEGVAVGCVLPY